MNEPTVTGQIFASFYVIYPILSILCYIISGFFLYKIAKDNNICTSWFAFIPIFQFYVIGKAIEEYEVFGRKIPKTQWTIFGIIVLQFITTLIPKFGIILALIIKAIWVLFLHKFFYLFDSRKAFGYSLFCMLGDIFMNIPFVIILILIRNKNMINSPGTYEYPF